MTVTVQLTPEIEEWIARKLEGGAFGSAADFVNARLTQDLLEEKIEEAFSEPASPLTNGDWEEARRQLEKTIAETQ